MKSLTTNSLEEDLIEIDLLTYMSGWVQVEMNELRSIISGETTYPQSDKVGDLVFLGLDLQKQNKCMQDWNSALCE